MLVKANDIIGLKVVTIKGGKSLDEVQDVVYDPKDNIVKALVIDEGGWFSDAKVIMFEDLKSIGEDAVIIDSEEKIKKASKVATRVANIAREEQNLTKTKVITEEGDELGSVSDILFNLKTGKVEELEVSQGARNVTSGKKTIRVSNIITVGEDATIVSGVAKQITEQQAQEKGLRGAINKATETVKQKVPQYMEQAKMKASELAQKAKAESKELSQKTKEKAEEIREHPKTQQAIETAKEKGKEAKETVEQKTQQVTKKTQQAAEKAKESRPRTGVNIYAQTVQVSGKKPTVKSKQKKSSK